MYQWTWEEKYILHYAKYQITAILYGAILIKWPAALRGGIQADGMQKQRDKTFVCFNNHTVTGRWKHVCWAI